ncbi:acetyltransferase (GNAT) family protein [Rathayibacter tanaceti]|nr:Acetyltransferase (GNAT) family protein [Rathayibacter tanaceti]TCO34771.1 acetyltransferase (GNAT) family protein [Rathayibacter tanaceti]
MLSADPLAFVVAEDDGLLQGFALVLPPGSGFATDPPEAAHLALLAVHPRAQGRGLARLLLSGAEEASAARASSAVLHVLTANPGAVSLYTSAGWQPEGPPVPHPLSGAPMLTLVRSWGRAATP